MTMYWKRLICVLLAVVITVSSSLVAATPTVYAAPTHQTTQPYPQAKKQLDDTFKQISALRKLIDRSQFDLGALGFALGGDAEAIIDFVRDEIAFEQYPGLLRGAQGTLQSRAGNALDQSLLLHQLLLDAGYEARILRGTLDEQSVQQLLQQMFKSRKTPPLVSRQMDKVEKILATLLTNQGGGQESLTALKQLLSKPTAITATTSYSVTQGDVANLQKLLATSGVTLGDPQAETKLRSEAADYFWVEYRLQAGNQWQTVYPALAATDLARPLRANEKFASAADIPDTLRHTIQLQATIERKRGDLYETLPIMNTYQANVADINGQTKGFAIVADGFVELADLDELSKSLQKSKFFFPMVNGKLANGAQFFDRLGNVLLPDQAASPFAALATGLTDSLGGAIEALDNQDNANTDSGQQSQFLLTSVDLTFTLTIPNAPAKSFQRNLYRLNFNRQTGVLAEIRPEETVAQLAALTAEQSFMLATSSYPPAMLADHSFATLLQLRPIYELALKSQYQRLAPEEFFDKKMLAVDFRWPHHLNLYGVFDAGAVPPKGANWVNYRGEASLVMHKQWQVEDNVSAMMDIVHNGRRSYAQQGAKIRNVPEALLQTGIWETRSEGLFLPEEITQPSNTQETNTQQTNTMSIFREAKKANIPIQVLTSTNRQKLATMGIPANAKSLIEQQLTDGNVIILPEKLPITVKTFGWWRLDPTTGQTLGILEGGGGATLVEYALLMSVSGLYAAMNRRICLDRAGGDANGISRRDLSVCGWGVGVAGGAGFLGAVLGATMIPLTAAGVGVALIVLAAIGLFGLAVGTGDSLNQNPSLDQPAF